MNHVRAHRRGVTSMLAMVYLIVFSTLAVGFYASTNSASMVSANEAKATRALTAAESGLDFMRYHLASVNIPAGTSASQLMSSVYSQLSARLDTSPNMANSKLYFANDTIEVPSSGSSMIDLGKDVGSFHATITHTGPQITVKVIGKYGGTALMTRGIRLTFDVKPTNPGILGYGLVTRGAVTMSSSIIKGSPDPTRGSIFTTSSVANPLSISGSTVISGNVFMSNPNGAVNGSGSIAGITKPSAWGDHVVAGAPTPDFPTVDPSPFIQYLASTKTTLVSKKTGKTTLSNIRVKAGSNVQFSGTTINGVIVIEAPNKVTFSGGCKITGVIVVDKPDDATATNAIIMSGGGSILGPENLPASYGNLRSMTGSAILAPNFALNFSGTSTSLGGSVIAKTATFSGGSGGTISGTLMLTGAAGLTMGASLSGGSTLIFANSPPGVPTGMKWFGGGLVPIASTYEELTGNSK